MKAAGDWYMEYLFRLAKCKKHTSGEIFRDIVRDVQRDVLSDAGEWLRAAARYGESQVTKREGSGES